MLGLVNRGLRAFVMKYHGRSAWQRLVASDPPLPSDFEVLMDYPADMTHALVAKIADLRSISQPDVLEDLGTFVVTSFWDARLRDLLLSCGGDFSEFMENLPHILSGVAKVNRVYGNWRISIEQRSRDQFELRYHGSLGAVSSLVIGLFRALADQYGALVTCSHRRSINDVEPMEAFVIRIFDKGETGATSPAPRDARALEEYFRAEVLQMVLDEAQGLIGRLDTARALAQSRANHDPLTGLLNRRGMSAWWDGNARALGSLALMHIDLDAFKPINDRFGHATGDELLRIVAERLKGTSRAQDAVARLGGDEFLFVTQAPERKSLEAICKRVEEVFDNPVSLTTHKIKVGASIGCVWQKGQGVSLNTLVQIADAALYRAKSLGKGQMVVHDMDATNSH